MRTFHFYPFYTDESATMWSDAPLLTIQAEEPPKELTRELLVALFLAMDCGTNVQFPHRTPELLKTWSDEKIADKVWIDYCLIFNKMAVIEDDGKNVARLKKIGDRWAKTRFGGDSSTYEACADFADMLTEEAIVVLDWPESNMDNEDAYKNDTDN